MKIDAIDIWKKNSSIDLQTNLSIKDDRPKTVAGIEIEWCNGRFRITAITAAFPVTDNKCQNSFSFIPHTMKNALVYDIIIGNLDVHTENFTVLDKTMESSRRRRLPQATHDNNSENIQVQQKRWSVLLVYCCKCACFTPTHLPVFVQFDNI